MSPYLFVAAVILAIIPILFIFKITMESIKEDPEQKNKAQIRFFIWVALSETIPLILIIYGMTNLTPVATLNELYTPAIIILFMMGFAALFIFLQRTFDVEKHMKEFIHTFAMISLAVTNAVPIIAIASLFMMMP